MSCNPAGVAVCPPQSGWHASSIPAKMVMGEKGMDHKGVFARKPVADIIALEGGAFKSLPKVLGRSA